MYSKYLFNEKRVAKNCCTWLKTGGACVPQYTLEGVHLEGRLIAVICTMYHRQFETGTFVNDITQGAGIKLLVD